MDIEKLLAANPAMTDIHLTEGLPLMIRVYGALKKMKEIAEPQLFAELISSYVPPDRQAAYQRTGSADSAFSLGNIRCRLHLYRSGGLASAAIRSFLCSARIPTGRGWRRYRSFRTGLSSSRALREAARVRRWRAFFR